MKLKINPPEQSLALLALIDGPVWKDECRHDQDCYVTSFEVINHKLQRMEKYDLYLFQNSTLGQEVCIRYGDEPSEYISPGPLFDFLIHGQHEPHFTAIKILRVYGRVTWELRSK